MMKKLRAVIMVLLLLMAVSAGSITAWPEENDHSGLTKDVKILFTSDVHCAIDQGWGYGGICAVKQNLSKDYHVLLVDDGDGFTMFREASVVRESDAADSEALLAYITGPLNGVISEEYADPYGQGRMISVGDN